MASARSVEALPARRGGQSKEEHQAPAIRDGRPEVVVVGDGAFAMEIRRRGTVSEQRVPESPGRSGGADSRGVVKPAEGVAATDVEAGEGTRMQVLVGPEDGAPNFVLRRFVMEAGGGIPEHTNEVEHEQYVLRGRARIRIGDEEHRVGPADSVYIPAGVPHAYEVVEGPFEFLCVVPNRPDEIRLLEEE